MSRATRVDAATVRRFGGVDIVVANAGIEMVEVPVVDFTEEQFDRLFSINTKGSYFTMQQAASDPSAEKRVLIRDVTASPHACQKDVREAPGDTITSTARARRRRRYVFLTVRQAWRPGVRPAQGGVMVTIRSSESTGRPAPSEGSSSLIDTV